MKCKEVRKPADGVLAFYHKRITSFGLSNALFDEGRSLITMD